MTLASIGVGGLAFAVDGASTPPFHVDGSRRYWASGGVGTGASGAVASPGSECEDGPEWVVTRVRGLLDRDGLTAHAVEVFGDPVSCEGEVTTSFDGVEYGIVRLGFAGGASLQLETMPISTMIMTLDSPRGFDDEALRRSLAEYTASLGLRIHWDRPLEEETTSEMTVFADPDPGLNAFVRLRLDGGRIRSVTVSVAS